MKKKCSGTVSVEVILGIAAGALVLMGIMQMTASSFLPKLNENVATLLSPSSDIGSEGQYSSAGNNSDSSGDTSNSGSNSVGGSDSQGGGNGNADGGNENAENSNNGVGDDGLVDSVGGGIIEDTAMEAFKNKIETIIDKTPHKKFTEKVMAVVDAISAVDKLLQAEKEIAKLNAEGKHKEAFGKTFASASRFFVDAVLSLPVVDHVIGTFPPQLEIAIKATIPNAIESVVQSAGENAIGGFHKKLWEAHDAGHIPMPSIPRDHQF